MQLHVCAKPKYPAPHTLRIKAQWTRENVPESKMTINQQRITEHAVTVDVGEAFYNPHTTTDREITIASLAAFDRTVDHIETYLDTFSATGIRGLRAAAELGLVVTLNDRDPDAVGTIKRNIVSNGLGHCCEVTNEDANVLLHKKRFDVVDIDPFGSPAPYLAAASRSARRMLAITATDTAPLCGAHLKSGIRKYAAVPMNNEYHAEIGVRVLMGAIARALAVVDRAMVPLLSYARRHYHRVYAGVSRGAASADRSIAQMGFIAHCPHCGFRIPVAGLAPIMPDVCRICGNRMQATGPLWLGALHNPAFCESVAQELRNRESGGDAIKLVEICKCELAVPTFYDQHQICHALKIPPITIDAVIDKLGSAGFSASRTHFSGTSFKTDADIREIAEILR